MPNQDVPLAKAHQIGLFDALVDRDELARGVAPLPMSERAILRHEEGTDKSGNRRKTFGDEVQDVLLAFFHQAQQTYGYDWAVLMLFRLISRDHDFAYIMPEWIRDLFEEERELLFGVFHGKTARGWELPGDEEEDDEQQEERENVDEEETVEEMRRVLDRMEQENGR